MGKPFDVIGTELRYQDRILALNLDRFIGSDGETRTYTRLVMNDWVNVVPLTDKHELVAIRQYRHGAGIWSVEVPAGGIDAGETPQQAGIRELAEETGVRTDSLISLGTFVCNAALQNNRVHTFLAFPIEAQAAFESSEGTAVLLPASEWLSDAFLTCDANLFSTAALLLARRYIERAAMK